MTDSVLIRGTGPHNDATLLLLAGNEALPDYITVHVTNRFRGDSGPETESAQIRLSPEQQDLLLEQLTRMVENRRALDFSAFTLSLQRARAYIRGET